MAIRHPKHLLVAALAAAALVAACARTGNPGGGGPTADKGVAAGRGSALLSRAPTARSRTITSKPTPKSPLRVELWGDSFSDQARDYLSFDFGLSGRATSIEHAYGGTALCDWFPDIRREIDPANRRSFHPQVAVIQFSGDAATPCMHDAKGLAYSGQALIDKYGADSAIAITMFTKAKIPVYFVSTPLSRVESPKYTGLTQLGGMFSTLPARFPAGGMVRYIDGATPLEWRGKFSATLPCAAWETCTGRWPDGTRTVVVRQTDGTHFCPVAQRATPLLRSCPVAMPGAQRFALAIAGPIIRDFHLR